MFQNKTAYPNSYQYIYYEPPSFAMKQDPYIPSYYHPKLGVYYDQFEDLVQSIYSTPSPPVSFDIGSSIPILTSVISDEKEKEKERDGNVYVDSLSGWYT